jgi:D-glycero-alpha-D-manno-heptose 1-phosphate guanylyltransferase
MKSGLTCVILTGGLGTRLRSILPDTPKPMACVNGRPFLEYLLTQVRVAGYTDVILCTGYKAEVIENYLADGRRYDVQIRYSRERELLGTAGALSQARHLIRSDPFLVMNGDSYCAVDFEELISQHQARNAVATIVTTRIEDRSRYGSVVVGPQDAIVTFSEKGETRGSGYINGGIYVISQTVLDLIPAGKYLSIERDIFPSLVGRGLYAFKTSGVFIDIGTPSKLQQAQSVLRTILGVDLHDDTTDV